MATLAGFIVYFILGFIFYGMLLMDFYAAHSGSASGVMRTDAEMMWWALIAGNVANPLQSNIKFIVTFNHSCFACATFRHPKQKP